MTRVRLRAVGLPLVLLALLCATAATSFADGGDPPMRAARISYLQGSVSFQPSGGTATDWSEATLNYPVTTGDRLYTDEGSRAELEVGEHAVRLSDSVDLTVSNLTDHFMQLGLARGRIRLSIHQLPADDSVEVDTPNGALTPLEPGEYRVDVAADDSATVVTVDRGRLAVSGAGLSETVESGEAVRLTGTDPIEIASVTPPERDTFDEWSADRDRRLTSSQSAQYVSPDVPGYEDLDDAGQWEVSAQYGPVWYPAGVPASWVPYRDGHWAWIDPWGWTWIEDERWGFAPFHYGRWVYVGSAWGWVPGPLAEPPCYAPALVAFVDGSQFAFDVGVGGVQAWFPLGPGEPYFPWYHHDRDYLRRVNAPDVRDVGTIIGVTNITAIHYGNRRVATTVVPTAIFRSGRPTAPRVLRVSPEQVVLARITPHPSIAPAASAAAGGRPAVRPPTITRPVMLTGAAPAPRVTSNPFLRNGPAGLPQRRPVPLISRQPPPPENPSFEVRQHAMQAHPGRPLEPQQVENLRAGRAAGPMLDREFPPHPAPAPRAAPSARPSVGSAARAAPRPQATTRR